MVEGRGGISTVCTKPSLVCTSHLPRSAKLGPKFSQRPPVAQHLCKSRGSERNFSDRWQHHLSGRPKNRWGIHTWSNPDIRHVKSAGQLLWNYLVGNPGWLGVSWDDMVKQDHFGTQSKAPLCNTAILASLCNTKCTYHQTTDNKQWRPLVTSTFGDQLNSYGEKSMRPRHIMVTSTMPNSLGEGCISLVLKPDILDNDWAFTNGNWCLTAQHVDQLLGSYHITRNHSWQLMGQNSLAAMNSMVWQCIQHSPIWFKWRPDWANVHTQTQGHKLNPTTQEFLSPWPKHTDLPNCKPINFYLFDLFDRKRLAE